jgi:hypothetical protein
MTDGIETVEGRRQAPARSTTPVTETLPPAYVWRLGRVEAEMTTRRFARRRPPPRWMQMSLQVNAANLQWFEGSISAWEAVDRPRVYWDEVATTVRRFVPGLEPPGASGAQADDPRTRALALLPHLYALGVDRVRLELNLPDDYKERIRLFPLIGFRPPEVNDEGELELQMIRMNVAVIDEAIFSLRLPDQPCPDRRTRDSRGWIIDFKNVHRRAREELELPRRFLPSWDAKALEATEELARHQASTVRALADEVRKHMPKPRDDGVQDPEDDDADATSTADSPQRPTLRGWLFDDGRDEAPPDLLAGWPILVARIAWGVVTSVARLVGRAIATGARWGFRALRGTVQRPRHGVPAPQPAPTLTPAPRPEVVDLLRCGQLSAVVDFTDRQIARLLRRFGTFGEDPERGLKAESDIRRRYQYALDEIRSVRTELASARERIAAKAVADREAEFQRFQFIAAVVGSAILVPTLIAGVFGANVDFPGKEDEAGLIALLLFIVAFGAGGAWLVDHVWKRDLRLPRMWRPVVGWVVILCVLAAAVILAFFAGQSRA